MQTLPVSKTRAQHADVLSVTRQFSRHGIAIGVAAVTK
jgi:hypothetical protein